MWTLRNGDWISMGRKPLNDPAAARKVDDALVDAFRGALKVGPAEISGFLNLIRDLG